jgi:hypothetical protein
MNQSKSNNIKAILIAVFVIALLEFIYILYQEPRPEKDLIQVNGSIEELLLHQATNIIATTPEKVLVFAVDAEDGSGKVKAKEGVVEKIINVAIPYYYDNTVINSLIETLTISSVSFVELKGKEARDNLVKNDEELIYILKSVPEIQNNLFTIDIDAISPSINNKYIYIPIKFKILQTGLYKFSISGKLDKAVLIDIDGKEKIKIAEAIYEISEDGDKAEILLAWNQFSQVFYIHVIDGTIPAPESVTRTPVKVY